MLLLSHALAAAQKADAEIDRVLAGSADLEMIAPRENLIGTPMNCHPMMVSIVTPTTTGPKPLYDTVSVDEVFVT